MNDDLHCDHCGAPLTDNTRLGLMAHEQTGAILIKIFCDEHCQHALNNTGWHFPTDAQRQAFQLRRRHRRN